MILQNISVKELLILMPSYERGLWITTTIVIAKEAEAK